MTDLAERPEVADRTPPPPTGWRALPWRGIAPAAVLLLAALLRLVGLGSPHVLVFDETYYVKDAWTLLHLGYEGSWPEDANGAFESGAVNGYTADPSFIAHPPLGKWIIALGLAAFGAESSIGWRISVALVGILLVGLTMLVAHQLFRSMTLTVIAGGLIAIEGNAIVMSRVALLDTMLAFFALLGVWFLLLDRAGARRRVREWIARRTEAGRATDWGPALWRRPWLVAASIAFGAAISVKWSGLYFLAVFAVLTLVLDAVDRRRAGVDFWLTGTLLKQGPVSFLLLVPLAAVVNLVSWTGWFVTDGGYARRWVEDGGEAWTGGLGWVPVALQNWWHYQASIYGYHVGESSPHAYASPAALWPFSPRPTSMHYEELGGGMVSAITGIPNPLIWWAATAALVFALVRLIMKRDAGAGVMLTGMLAGWAPWLLYPERTMFQFYAIAYEPFAILALTLAIGVLLRGRSRVGLVAVGAFLGVAALLSAYFLPMWTGMPIPEWFLRSHYWFRTWI